MTDANSTSSAPEGDSITLELPDDLYAKLSRMAEGAGEELEDYLRNWMIRFVQMSGVLRADS